MERRAKVWCGGDAVPQHVLRCQQGPSVYHEDIPENDLLGGRRINKKQTDALLVDQLRVRVVADQHARLSADRTLVLHSSGNRNRRVRARHLSVAQIRTEDRDVAIQPRPVEHEKLVSSAVAETAVTRHESNPALGNGSARAIRDEVSSSDTGPVASPVRR